MDSPLLVCSIYDCGWYSRFIYRNLITFSILLNGELFSVILGLSVAIEKITNYYNIAVAFFGAFHGLAHGIEMPWAANPLLLL